VLAYNKKTLTIYGGSDVMLRWSSMGEVRSNVPLHHQRANYTYHIEKDTLLGN